jgi:hypothetical protein
VILNRTYSIDEMTVDDLRHVEALKRQMSILKQVSPLRSMSKADLLKADLSQQLSAAIANCDSEEISRLRAELALL